MKYNNKQQPEKLTYPVELQLNAGVLSMRGFDVDAWTTEQTLLTSLKSHISLAITGAQTAYRVHNANCKLGDIIFQEALLTMSDRADITHKWFSNYIVHDVVLYASKEPVGENPSLPEVVAKTFTAEQIVVAKRNTYIGKTGALVVTATAGSVGSPSTLRVTFNNNLFASVRFIETDMLPVITPKSGAILLNGAFVQAKGGKELVGQVPVPCTEFDGNFVMPDVSYFDLPAIVTIQFAGPHLSRVHVAPECSLDELNAWRKKNFGETDDNDLGRAYYRLDTTDGYTARVIFFKNRPELTYEFERTERT